MATLTISQILRGHVFRPNVVNTLREGTAGIVEYNRDAPLPNGYDPKKEQGAFYYVFRPDDVQALIAHATMYHALGDLFNKAVSAEEVIAAIQAGRLVLVEGDNPDEPKATSENAPAEVAAGEVPPSVVASTNGGGPSVTAFGSSTRKGKKTD